MGGLAGERARDPERAQRQPDLHPEQVAAADAEPCHRGRRQQHRVFPQQVEGIDSFGEQAGLQLTRPEQIDPDDRQRFVAPRDPRLDLERRTDRRDSGPSRDQRIQRLVETFARTPQRQIGIPGQHPRRLRHLADRRRIDDLHREAERHAERDRQHRDGHPPGKLPSPQGVRPA